MCLFLKEKTFFNNGIGNFDSVSLVSKEGIPLGKEPWQNIIIEFTIELWLHQAHISQALNGVLLEADEELLGHNSRDVLLVSESPLIFAGFLLDLSARLLLLYSLLSCFKSLGFDQLSVSDFFEFLLLSIHDPELILLKHFHPRLLKRLKTKHIQHGLNLLIEVKQLPVSIEDLSGFTVLLSWHFWLKNRHRWPVQVEFRSDADLLSWWLVGQILPVLVCLDRHVLSAWDWLG